MELIILLTKDFLSRRQVSRAILYLVEARHIKTFLSLPDVHQSRMAAAGNTFQCIAHLIVVEHPEVSPDKDVLPIPLIDSDDAVNGNGVLTFRILLAEFIYQITVDGREIVGLNACLFYLSLGGGGLFVSACCQKDQGSKRDKGHA